MDSVERYWVSLIAWGAGTVGTACVFHSFRIHFHHRAPWMSFGTMLVWGALILLANLARR